VKKLVLIILTLTLFTGIACSSTQSTSGLKKISLSDAPEILNITSLLPARFAQVDPANEGMSNKDMGLGSDCSEVQLFVSNDPFQMVYGFMTIINSSIEGAVFDRQLEDDNSMKDMIKEAILAGAEEEGVQAAIPDITVSHPDLGDSSIYGKGSLEIMGFYFGFDILFFRNNKVYIFLYSLSMTSDEIDLLAISKEVGNRVSNYSQ
jgi:hypothetical protein